MPNLGWFSIQHRPKQTSRCRLYLNRSIQSLPNKRAIIRDRLFGVNAFRSWEIRWNSSGNSHMSLYSGRRVGVSFMSGSEADSLGYRRTCRVYWRNDSLEDTRG